MSLERWISVATQILRRTNGMKRNWIVIEFHVGEFLYDEPSNSGCCPEHFSSAYGSFTKAEAEIDATFREREAEIAANPTGLRPADG